VSGYFRFGRAGGEASNPWFRIGTLDVGTTMLVVLLSVVSLVVFAFEPPGKPIQVALAMIPTDVAHGQLWRLVTWPLANLYVSFWVAVSIFFFWYFGSELERSIGRVKMLVLLAGTAGLIGVAGTVIDLAIAGQTFYQGGLSGLNLLGLLLALVFIAEYPHIRFFFGIPGWVIGVVIVGIQVITLLGYREIVDLLTFLASLVIVAVMARSVGLLAERSFIPALPKLKRRRKRTRRSSSGSGQTVVPGPWEAPQAPPVSRDQAELDALLDKIHASGMDSLSDHEREQLLILRDRLRRR
jgi:membrane associated rhomboid family serine protease